jgi:voltage-gated potassium channel
LMIVGSTMRGVVTAALASWFIERLGHFEAVERETQRDLDVVLTQVRSLRDDIDQDRQSAVE